MVKNKISAEQVIAEVKRYWKVFEAKNAEALADCYTQDCLVFGSTSSRAEPGRLAAIRREREYFQPQSTVKVEVGTVDVIHLSDHAAAAVYNFKFHATKVATLLGKPVEEKISNGRASQVFMLGSDGRLRVCHEHLSLPAG